MVGSMIIRMISLMCLPLIFSIISESCLDGTAERLISGSRYRVQDQFFETNSKQDKFIPQQARLEGNSPWCVSRSHQATSEYPWLQVTFGTVVNISKILTISTRNSSMTSFQVHVGDGTEGSLHPLTVPGDSTQSMVFVSMGTSEVENIMLPSPVITRVLRIVAEGRNRKVCLKLEAIGCIVSPVCENERLLTDDNELLDSIIASPPISSEDAINALNSTNGSRWCTKGSPRGNNSGSDPYMMYFQLDFTSMVSLTYMVAQSASNAYVRQFRLEVQDESGNFDMYGTTSEPTTFIASGTDQEIFTFWRPIQGNLFRLQILDVELHNSLLVCWNIKLYGCIANASTSLSSSTVPMTPTQRNTEASPSPSQETQPTEEASPSPSQETRPTEEMSATASNTKQRVVGEAVGMVLCLLVVLLLLAIVVAVFFIFKKERSVQTQLTRSHKAISEHKFGKTVMGKEESKTENHLKTPDIPASITSNIYESIITPPYGTTILYGSDPNETAVPHGEEMIDNPLYSKTREDFKIENHLGLPPSNIYESIHTPCTAIGAVDPHDEDMLDNPLYVETNGEDFKMEHHLLRPGIHSSTIAESIPTNPTRLYRYQNSKGNADPHDEERIYNRLYSQSSEEGFKKVCHLSIPGCLSPIATNTYESIPSGTEVLHDEMLDNLLYAKSGIEGFKMEYHPDRSGIASSITSNITESIPIPIEILNELIQGLNGTYKEMLDNCHYAKNSGEDKVENHLDTSFNIPESISTTKSPLGPLVQDDNGTKAQHEEM